MKDIESILCAYGLSPGSVSIHPMHGNEGGVDRIDSVDGHQWALRTFDRREKARAEAACRLKYYLSETCDSLCERPVKALCGDFTVVPVEASSSACSIHKWVQGSTYSVASQDIRAKAPEYLGRAMSLMHSYGNEAELADMGLEKNVSKTYLRDYERLLSMASECTVDLECLVRELTIQLNESKEMLPRTIIHGDINEGNYIIGSNVVTLIDFNRCGFGLRDYDLATGIMHLSPKERASCLAGYILNAPEVELVQSSMDLFFVCAVIDNMAFLATLPGEEEYIQTTAKWICNAWQTSSKGISVDVNRAYELANNAIQTDARTSRR